MGFSYEDRRLLSGIKRCAHTKVNISDLWLLPHIYLLPHCYAIFTISPNDPSWYLSSNWHVYILSNGKQQNCLPPSLFQWFVKTKCLLFLKKLCMDFKRFLYQSKFFSSISPQNCGSILLLWLSGCLYTSTCILLAYVQQQVLHYKVMKLAYILVNNELELIQKSVSVTKYEA